jgi:anti-sigma B factor antagonist
MNFATETRGDVTIIALDGNLMGGPDAGILNSKLHEQLASGTKRFVLDLSKVQFINSSGLGLLIGGVNAVRAGGGKLLIAGASEKILALFTITKLQRVFEHHPTVDVAVTALKK